MKFWLWVLPFTVGALLHGSVQADSFVLRVLTYNVHGLPIPFGYDHTTYYDIGKVFKDERDRGVAPHIVALQETFHERTRDIRDVAQFPFWIKGPNGNVFRSNSGLEILSEFAISEKKQIVFDDCTGADCMSRKGLLYTEIKVPGLPVPLAFLNTHMNAGNDNKDAEVRLTQVQEIKKFFDRHDRGLPNIFIGDFNFRPHEYEYQSFVSLLGHINSTEECMSLDCDGSGDEEEFYTKEPDHQFYRQGHRLGITITPIYYERKYTEPVNGRKLSDHDGLEIHYLLEW